MDPGYPKPITVWKGVPDAPQGAFVHKENGTRMRAAPCMPLPAAARVSERRTAAARCRLGGSRPGLGALLAQPACLLSWFVRKKGGSGLKAACGHRWRHLTRFPTEMPGKVVRPRTWSPGAAGGGRVGAQGGPAARPSASPRAGTKRNSE